MSRSFNHRFRQTGQVFFLVYHQQIIVVIGQYMVAEFNGQRRQLFVDFAQTLLLLCIQSRTRTDKFLVIFIQQIMLFSGQRDFSGLLLRMHGSYPLIQILVQENIVTVFRQHWSDFALQCHQFIVRIGFSQSKEHPTHPSQDFPTVIQRHNGIFESRFFRILHNGLDFLILLLNAFQESRFIMFHLNPVEIRRAIRRFKLSQKRIVRISCLLSTGTYHTTHSGCKN